VAAECFRDDEITSRKTKSSGRSRALVSRVLDAPGGLLGALLYVIMSFI
jgi:hypothetical protein